MNLKEIQQKLKAPKSKEGYGGKYRYRSCEDVLELVKPLLGESTLTLSDEIVYIGTRHYVKATATLKNGDKEFSVSACAREAESQSGMAESQITGSASSYARKYALNGLFLIDDSKDDDVRNTGKDDYETKKDIMSPAYKAALLKTIAKETRIDKLNNIKTIAFAQYDFTPDSKKKLEDIFMNRKKELEG